LTDIVRVSAASHWPRCCKEALGVYGQPNLVSNRMSVHRTSGPASGPAENQLLTLLRLWWKEGKRRGLMLPHGWLFPGRGCTDLISTRQINRAIHEAAKRPGSGSGSRRIPEPVRQHPLSRLDSPRLAGHKRLFPKERMLSQSDCRADVIFLFRLQS
jgi:hypothetical protein